MSQNWADHPYKTIGWHLKFAREQLKESLAEVSGAVEVEENILDQIEKGLRRPSEEILLLLISHFNMHDAEANSLWDLAGYDKDDELQSNVTTEPVVNQIAYTDMVQVTANNYGLVMNFIQGDVRAGKINYVARVGMSKDHARKVIEILQTALKQPKQKASKPKYLPAPKNLTDSN